MAAVSLRAKVVMALLFLWLGACATTRQPGEVGAPWPEGAPPARYFVDIYRNDDALHAHQTLDDYLLWVARFYEGTTFYPKGWQDLVAEKLSAIEDRERAALRSRQLHRLGREIAAEWAKDNSIRRVDTRLLLVWGEATGRAFDDGNVDETLGLIASDLARLKSDELEPELVRPERYHPQDPEDWFAF